MGTRLLGKKVLHWPGVEPGARPWEDPMLPLHHQCLFNHEVNVFLTGQSRIFFLTRTVGMVLDVKVMLEGFGSGDVQPVERSSTLVQ